ncbi:MAG: murein biosynthesis integral membrane protein MurJ [Gammaproteobacteria bacterium]|nr:murein biosynthesis integral membrane protein MurJ [Gammaproteobacteria bacterium]
MQPARIIVNDGSTRGQRVTDVIVHARGLPVSSPAHSLRLDAALSQRLFKSTAIVGGMTFISRILGYARDAVVFISFGAGGGTDAFFVAFRIPNFLRRLVAEGAFSQAFVPIFSEYREHREPAALKDLADHVAGTLAVILMLITVTGVIAAPLLVSVFAPGFMDNPERHALTVDLLRVTFPYIFFISLTALAGGILNSIGRFAVPAFTPVFLNLSLIAASLWLAPIFERPITGLAWGVFIAGVVQLAFQLPFLYRLNLLPQPRLARAHEGVRRILRLMGPAIFGSSVVQINVLFNTMIASFLAVGSISWLYASDRFVELPLALLGVATATVILPRLSQQHTRQSGPAFSQTLDWALRISVLVALPATLALLLLAGPILATLLQYREFTAIDTRMSTMSLIAYGAGLPAFILIKVLAPGFYARQDTKTPVRIGVIAVLSNMALNVLIVAPWLYFDIPGPHSGLAAGTTLSAYLNASLLYHRLRSDGVYRMQPGWAGLTLKVGAATAVMGSVLIVMTPALGAWSEWAATQRGLHLCILIALGAAAYVLSLALLGVRPRQFAAGAA